MNDQPPPVPLRPTPKTSGLAITSMVLGILGITCLLPVIGPILALALGIVALNQINKSQGQLSGQGQAIAAIVMGGVGLVALPIMAAMLLPALNAAREKARRANCMANMRQLAVACKSYEEEHNGDCPKQLDDLKKYFASDPEKIFHCPSARDQSTPSYQIVCEGKADGVLLRENPTDHRGMGSNVAFNDGHVEWVRAGPAVTNPH